MPEGLVTRAVNGFFEVASELGSRTCRARGVFRKKGITVLVGDKVAYDPIGMHEGIITEVHPRVTELIRPPIANVTQAILVFSIVTPDFQANLLDRLLVNVTVAGLKPVIVVTKCDLAMDEEVNGATARYHDAGYTVILTSSATNTGIQSALDSVRGHINVLAGPSGAGKSTLANAMVPGLQLQMGDVSEKLGRGRHTTRHVELFQLAEDTYLADAPGFSQLDLQVSSAELWRYFPDILPLAEGCEYRGCEHMDEKDCAVKIAVGQGELSPERYENYRVLMVELRDREESKYS